MKPSTIIWVWIKFYPLPLYWFSFNTLETIKAVTLATCSIQQHFIRYIHAKFGISNSLQYPELGQNLDGGISDFWISGESPIKENCPELQNQ